MQNVISVVSICEEEIIQTLVLYLKKKNNNIHPVSVSGPKLKQTVLLSLLSVRAKQL